ncbi:MAG: hypothetical protein ACNA78_06760 [Balneolaceae bacterium]
MGRAMIIICAGILVSLGIVSMSTSNQGKAITQKTVNYAEYVMAKNAAHTALQITMQEINQDEDWPDNHSIDNPWVTTVQGIEVAVYTDHRPDDDFWEPDSLWLFSNASYRNDFVQVNSLYLKQPFSSLVPDFVSALTVTANPDNVAFNIGGNAKLFGKAPSGTECEDMPAISTIPNSEQVFQPIQNHNSNNVSGDPLIHEDPTLSYEPTDELIARLANTDGVQFISGSYKGSMGTADNPGVFFVEDNARLTGGIDEGYGILVVRSFGALEYEGEDGTTLDIAGNFRFNGLVIFENAYNFTGRGTPTINGSVLVGQTEDFPEHQVIDIDLSGDIEIQFDCQAEQFAKMAAANAVKQNKYTRIVTRENVRYTSTSSDGSILDKLLGIF